MECGEQCVAMAGVTMMPELCANNWGTVSTQVEVNIHIDKSHLYSNRLQTLVCKMM